MTDLRDAARQALEALMWHDETVRTRGDDEAIEAVRAALEQYDKDRVWIEERKANWALQRKLVAETPERDKQQQEYEEARSAALEQPNRAQAMRDAGYSRRPTLREMSALEQPEQPVAWCDIEEDGTIHGLRYWSEPGRREHALYTHPPRREWRSLSEEEIQSIHDTYHKRMGPQEFARAVEAKLKERNP